MNAKKYLTQILRMEILISQLKMELANLNLYEAAKIDEFEKHLESDITQYLKFRNKIVTEIQSLENVVYMQILYKRYVEMKHIAEIAKEMKYDYYHISHLHSKALMEFGKKILR